MEAFGGFGKRAAARNLANDALTLLLRTSCVLLAFQRIEASLINEKPCQRRTTIFAPCLSSSLYRLPQQQLQRSLPLHMEGSDNENESTVTLNDSISVEPTYYYYSPNVPLNNDRWNDATADQSEELAAAAVASASTTTSTNEYSFFDEAVIVVRAGSGGQGSATYKKAAGGQNGAPDGGSGGRGGSVILVTDPSLNTLAGLTNAWRPNSFGGSGAAASSAAAAATSATTTFRPKSFRADNGGDGERGFKNGAFGNDDIIRVPPGTVVQEQIVDRDTGTTVRIVDLVTLTAPAANDEDLVSATTSLLVARGGEGGEGSAVKNRGVRRPRAPPKGGERKVLKLTLKIVADVALVGVPNAGKSTFLAAVTRYVCYSLHALMNSAALAKRYQ